jgi:uncharacterized protein (TIGR03085 family)
MPQPIARSERQALCSLLEDTGPLAPTLCEGWTTADLAAHLFVREYRPLASPGILLPAFAELTQRAMDRAKGDLGYSGLISRIRVGPPLPMRLVDAQVNALEYFVHHEDVRRAGTGATPRDDDSLDAALWPMVKRGARFMSRHVEDAGLELVAPSYGSVIARQGEPRVIVTGGPQELALLLFGRMKAAVLHLEGTEAAKAAVSQARFGI